MNKTFQWLWYRIFKKLIPVSKDLQKIECHYDRIIFMIRLAKIFNLKKVLIGDSNVQAGDKYATMKLYSKTTINLGFGGSTIQDWLIFFCTPLGKKIYDLIKDYEIIINLGGNNLLLDKMDSVKDGMDALKRLFPNAWYCTVPSVNDQILAELSKAMPIQHDSVYYHNGVIAINGLIHTIFYPRIIDLYQVTLDPTTQEENPMLFKDMVHFNDFCFQHIIRVIEDQI